MELHDTSNASGYHICRTGEFYIVYFYFILDVYISVISSMHKCRSLASPFSKPLLYVCGFLEERVRSYLPDALKSQKWIVQIPKIALYRQDQKVFRHNSVNSQPEPPQTHERTPTPPPGNAEAFPYEALVHRVRTDHIYLVFSTTTPIYIGAPHRVPCPALCTLLCTLTRYDVALVSFL